METSFINSETDPLLLLKERIIKSEVLLEKYACLTRKFNELEKSQSQAVENEKKAKKDAIKYLEKYCKLTKKCNCLLTKIKTLEDSITEKTNELKKCQDEYARLESVLFMYQTERKGHQCLKKDKDFLLSALWKLLKRLTEEPRDFKIKKLAETFFKRFQRDLTDLKLEDFRSSKIKNISKLTEKEKSDILFSPGSEVLDSVESDFIDTDIAPESVKSSLDEFDRNCILEEIDYVHIDHGAVDKESCSDDPKTVENLTSQPLPFNPYISEDSEEDFNLNLTEKNVADTSEYIHASGNNGFNPSNNQELENRSTDIYSINLPTIINKTSESVTRSDGQIQSECCNRGLNFNDNFFPLESKDRVLEAGKIPEKFKKNYGGRKAIASSQNDFLRKLLFDYHNLSSISCSTNEDNAAVNPICNIKSVDIDYCSVSSETVGIDMSVPMEDMGNVPRHNENFKWIYDFFIASDQPSLLEKNTSINEDSPSLLFLMENEMETELDYLNYDTDKTVIPEPCKTVSVFDVEDNENSKPSRSVDNNDLLNISLEFSSDSGNMIDLTKESVDEVCEVDGEKHIFEHSEVSKKVGGENQLDKQLRNNSGSMSKESNIGSHRNQFSDNMIKNKDHNSELVQGQHLEKSDEEISRILQSFKIVPLLSPLKEREENTKRKLCNFRNRKELRNLSQNIKAESNLNWMGSFEDILDVVHKHSSVLETKTDCLEQFTGVQKTEPKVEETGEKTEESVIVPRRSSRIRNRTTSPMSEESPKAYGLNFNECRNAVKIDSFGISLPHTNSDSMTSSETTSNKESIKILPMKEASVVPKSLKLKERFEELFGEPESQSDCSLPESRKNFKTANTPTKAQEQVSPNLQTDACENSVNSVAAVSKRRRLSHRKAIGSRTIPKSSEWDSFSVEDNENFEEKSTENINLNNTYSSETVDNGNFLDSIMTAMTKQTESFKVKTVLRRSEEIDTNNHTICLSPQPLQLKNCIPTSVVHRKINQDFQAKGDSSAFLNLPYYWNVDNQLCNRNVKEKTSSSNLDRNRSEDVKLKTLVQEEISKFLKMDINSLEKGEEKVKSCVSVLEKASEDIIANVIVSEIMANVDEELKEFERPAPPLTQTQHRIMIILTVLSRSDEQFCRISNKILKIIWSKIFPENFFWPDDSLEMATRFYTALCKRLNNFKGIWKFCYKVIVSMRQRWCIPIFVVLQVWPDIIHNANEIQDNLLVNTFVNVILHTPKSEELRRKRQEQKLLAVKHLLINFYNFDVNVTIEEFAGKLLESLFNHVPGSVDALVLLSKCRNWLWTRKNVVTKLLQTLDSWLDGKVSDIIVSKVLDVLEKISPIFPNESSAEASSALDLIALLKRLLSAEKADQVLKEKTIRILCSLCHYPDVKDILSRLLGKFSCSDPLYSDIIKALSSKKRKRKEGIRKADGKTKRKLKNKTKSKKRGKRRKRSSSHQKIVLDIR